MGIDPTLQQLRVFLVVAEELHFGRAAARMHMAQPPVTRQVKALEAALGVQLFERSSRRVALTPAGSLLRREVEALLARWDLARSRARDMAARQARIVTLGCIEAMAIGAVPTAIAQLRALRPDVEWELREDHTPALLDGLRAARYDCVVVRGPIARDAEIDSVVVHNDELVAALPQGHRLAGDELNLEALADEDFIAYSRSAQQGLQSSVFVACVRAGFVPRIRHEALGTQLVLGLVAAGDGVAVVSATAARTPQAGVQFVRLAGRTAMSQVVLAWRRGLPVDVMERLAEVMQAAALDPG
jgi:DNA-binding transcriptional LysR family regulator